MAAIFYFSLFSFLKFNLSDEYSVTVSVSLSLVASTRAYTAGNRRSSSACRTQAKGGSSPRHPWSSSTASLLGAHVQFLAFKVSTFLLYALQSARQRVLVSALLPSSCRYASATCAALTPPPPLLMRYPIRGATHELRSELPGAAAEKCHSDEVATCDDAFGLRDQRTAGALIHRGGRRYI